MSAAVVPDVIIVRHDRDIGCPPLVVPDEPDDLVVSPVGGPGENAPDPGQALIAGARVLKVAVKNDNALERRMIMAPSRDLKSESASRVFQSASEAGLQFRDPVDEIIAVDEDDFL